MKNYNEILRELRTDKDLTQAQVAEVLNIRQEYYSKYELGKRPLPIHHLKKLCQFYGVSADYILGLPKSLKWPR
jgi:transcriptional regulator with XRE-family HTH domain